MKRRRHLLASLAAAAALVTGCGVRGESTPSRLDDVSLPQEPVPEEAAPDDEGPTTIVYFVRGERLEAVERPVPTTLASALRGLFEGPRETETDGGLRSAIPAGTALLRLTMSAGVADVDLSEGFASVVGPEQVLALAQLVYTATAISGVSAVRLAIEGQPVDAASGDGRLAPGPVGRDDYPALLDG